MTRVPIAKISDTAYWVAYYRGLEGWRPDALFSDPLAARLAGERGRMIAQAMPGGAVTSWIIALRTCIIDDFIHLAIAEGVDTVLNLGAGLDTRPYRMKLPSSLSWIETDSAEIIDIKEEQLQAETPRCRLTRYRCDLSNGTERMSLLSRINAESRKLLVLTEGVVPYLDNAEAATLAADLRSLDHADYWLVDYFSPEAVRNRPREIDEKMVNAPFKFAPEDWAGFFAASGWHIRELRYFADEADRRNRQPELPIWLWFIMAMETMANPERRDALRTSAGFALMEPSQPGKHVQPALAP